MQISGSIAGGCYQFNGVIRVFTHLLFYPDEKPSIGIIICRSKNRTVVEYALRSAISPMGVATYQIHNEVPEELRELLPDPGKITEILDSIEIRTEE